MSEAPHRVCLVIPTYDNPRTVRDVVLRARAFITDIIVVDDGSAPAGRRAVESIGADQLAHVVHRPANGGKGAAMKTGFATARALGFTHALQIDADGQHTLSDIPKFLEQSRLHPEALVCGYPVFDRTVPLGRLIGRQITVFWVMVETGGRGIVDTMCGFRVYPLAQTAIVEGKTGDRMDFDTDIAVRLLWNRVPVINLPTNVRYLTADEGGISHFHMFGDNVRISWLHTRLTIAAIGRLFRAQRALP